MSQNPSELQATKLTHPARNQQANLPAADAAMPKARTKCTFAIDCQPTLRQAWPRYCPRPQYAFKISMFNVSCNSH